jgi:hypothetical protein
MKKIVNTLYYISGGLLFTLIFACIVGVVLKMLNLITFLGIIKLIIIFAIHLVFIQVPLLIIIRYLEKKHSL